MVQLLRAGKMGLRHGGHRFGLGGRIRFKQTVERLSA
jgi:hypothetical protein